VRRGSLLFLDACCLINLFATGRIEEILLGLPYRFATSRFVAEREVLSLAHSPGSSGPLEREAVSLLQLESTGRLSLVDLSTVEEKAELIRFAADLDDGEASVCALAVIHGAGVATDDRKALRVLGQATQVPTIQTPEILYEWASRSRVPEGEIGEVLRAVQDRARFSPRRDAPRSEWWARFLR
jgi:hypothetical protein